MTGVEWAAWSQALAAYFALAAGPQALSYAWQRLYYRFEVTDSPRDLKSTRGATHWMVTFHNKSKKMQSLKTIVYPKKEGVTIAFADVVTVPDGGFAVDKALLEDGALTLQVRRCAPDRRFDVNVVFTSEDIPRFETSRGSITDRVEFKRATGRSQRASLVLTSHVRLMMLLLNFYVAVMVVIGRLIYIAVKG
jgi:hypothetical protein